MLSDKVCCVLWSWFGLFWQLGKVHCGRKDERRTSVDSKINGDDGSLGHYYTVRAGGATRDKAKIPGWYGLVGEKKAQGRAKYTTENKSGSSDLKGGPVPRVHEAPSIAICRLAAIDFAVETLEV